MVAEDNPAGTLLPYEMLQGANLDRVFFVSDVLHGDVRLLVIDLVIPAVELSNGRTNWDNAAPEAFDVQWRRERHSPMPILLERLLSDAARGDPGHCRCGAETYQTHRLHLPRRTADYRTRTAGAHPRQQGFPFGH